MKGSKTISHRPTDQLPDYTLEEMKGSKTYSLGIYAQTFLDYTLEEMKGSKTISTAETSVPFLDYTLEEMKGSKTVCFIFWV